MAKPTLNVHLLVAEGREHECAAALQTQLAADQFRILCQLAAELVSRWESVSSGGRVVVLTAADPAAEVARVLRLRPAGQNPG